MLTSLPPETLGAALSSAALGALLDMAGFLAVVAILAWIITNAAPPAASSAPSAPQSRMASMASMAGPLHTAMTPLEVDLATVETLPALSTVQTVTAASPDIVEALRSELLDETPNETPNDTPMPSSGSSLAVLDAWPPAPRRPGEKTYRYVLASGRLVRLRDLRLVEALAPSRNMLN